MITNQNLIAWLLKHTHTHITQSVHPCSWTAKIKPFDTHQTYHPIDRPNAENIIYMYLWSCKFFLIVRQKCVPDRSCGTADVCEIDCEYTSEYVRLDWNLVKSQLTSRVMGILCEYMYPYRCRVYLNNIYIQMSRDFARFVCDDVVEVMVIIARALFKIFSNLL